MERLHVVDGHGYIFRAHFGLMNASSRSERKEVRLSTKDGMPTGALYVFARMLLRLHDDVGPERIAVVFDAGRKSFRTEIFPEYKAHRPPAPEDLAIQMPRFAPLVEALGWPVLAIPGVEADDVVATLAAAAAARGWECTIYSADKDLMQLVGEHTAVIDAMRAQTYTRAAVIEKFGVPPDRLADFLALRGDTSDNIPGVAGVGDKTAAELVNAYPDLEALIAANPKVRGKHPLGDPAQIERLRISRRLVELDRAVALPTPVEDLRARSWDRPALTAMFQELEFANLVEKVERTVAARADAVAAAGGDDRGAGEPGPGAGGGRRRGGDRGGVRRGARGRAGGAGGRDHRPLRSRDGDRRGAGGGRPRAGLRAAGPPLARGRAAAERRGGGAAGGAPGRRRGGQGDPRLQARRALPGAPRLAGGRHRRRSDAGAVPDRRQRRAERGDPGRGGRRDVARARGRGRQGRVVRGAAPAEAAAWLGVAAAVTRAAAPRLRAQLDAASVIALYDDLELPIARILCELERTGICIDRAHFEKLSAEVAAADRRARGRGSPSWAAATSTSARPSSWRRCCSSGSASRATA
jgi:DNA polymerase-1